MLDENELGPYGIRSLSRYHLDHPFTFWIGGREYKVQYLPAESNTRSLASITARASSSSLRTSLRLLRALLSLYAFYGDDFKVQCPTGSGRYMTLFEVANEIKRRLANTFLRDATGRRPVYGGTKKFQENPHWRGLILFYEYFHGDNGAGLGASHQTGWTGLIAFIMDFFGPVDASWILDTERVRRQARLVKELVGGHGIREDVPEGSPAAR